MAEIKFDFNKKIPDKKVRNFTGIVVGGSVGAFWTVVFIVALSKGHNKLPGGFEINIPDPAPVHAPQDTALQKIHHPLP